MTDKTNNLYTFEEKMEAGRIYCRLLRMGEDYQITVSGGIKPHIGTVVLAQARESLTGEGISATSSVINVVGHKDEAVARNFAEKIAIAGRCTAVCSCGIHIDHATEMQLLQIKKITEHLLDKCLKKVDEAGSGSR